MSKGSRDRTKDRKKYEQNWKRIFKKWKDQRQTKDGEKK